ncbi:sulfite exporter TauE/SafE family protein [Paenalcaligenes hominis]|uniref:sulfite exporter TauE/SafE family protein n=1 Tax=Paenalcaligenes hominis TaxID=643674 RepID=UPI0035266187
MDLSTITLIIAGAVIAGFVQGLSGFAFSMVAMSFWAWAVDPKIAAVLAVFGALTGQVLAVFSVRREFNPSLLAPFVVGGLCGIPLGVWVLPLLDSNWFKVFIGALLILWCPIMLFSKTIPTPKPTYPLVNGFIGILGGVMSGLGGFAGAIPTLWCYVRGYDRHTQRAVIQNFNLAILGVTMVTYLATGLVTTSVLPLLALVLPAMLIPTLLGTRIYKYISDAVFRKVVLSLLIGSGLALLSSAIPQVLS